MPALTAYERLGQTIQLEALDAHERLAQTVDLSGAAALNLADASPNVVEDAANGTVVATLAATGGTSPYTYAIISGDTDSAFEIVGDELRVYDNTKLSYPETYNLTIRVTDNVSDTDDAAYTVTVTEAASGSITPFVMHYTRLRAG